jgi:hypothetical protein
VGRTERRPVLSAIRSDGFEPRCTGEVVAATLLLLEARRCSTGSVTSSPSSEPLAWRWHWLVTRLPSRPRATSTQASPPMRREGRAHLEDRGLRPSELPHERSFTWVQRRAQGPAPASVSPVPKAQPEACRATTLSASSRMVAFETDLEIGRFWVASPAALPAQKTRSVVIGPAGRGRCLVDPIRRRSNVARNHRLAFAGTFARPGLRGGPRAR